MISLPPFRTLALLAAGSFFCLPAWSHAQGSAPTPNPSGKEYVLARRSSFEAPVGAPRNPFWPIGWVPSASAPKAEVTLLDVQANAFRLTTTSVDYPPLAVINGRTYGVGEQVPVAGHTGASVTVRQIMDGMVVLDYHGHELRVTDGPAPRLH